MKPVARTASPDGGSARAQHTRRQADSVAFKQMIKVSWELKSPLHVWHIELVSPLQLIQKGMWTRHGAYFAAYITSLITRVFVTVKLADVGGRNAGYFGTRQWSKMFTTQVRSCRVTPTGSLKSARADSRAVPVPHRPSLAFGAWLEQAAPRQ